MTSNPQGLGYGLLLACLLYVRLVFTAASSVTNDGVFVKYLWNFLPEGSLAFSEMDGNKRKKQNKKNGGRERGRRTEETIHFQGLNRSAV